ncbi:MAG: hypothetical protein WD077_00460 [Bacteroidia bacterium]
MIDKLATRTRNSIGKKVTQQVTPQVTQQVIVLLKVFDREHKRQELQERTGLSDREHFRSTYLQPAIDDGYIELTIPDKPQSSNQQYRLTEKGRNLIRSLNRKAQ